MISLAKYSIFLDMHIYKLENTIQEYDWGSRTLIPELFGKENPEDTPQAELWMGIHPIAESRVIRGQETLPLSEVIAVDPEGVLGKQTARMFRNNLPFLLKVLAAGKPLSLQAHPDLEQARSGFERENRAGIPLDARERNYRDDNHKPELIYAITPFIALNGFRNIDEIIVELLTVASSSLSMEIDGLKHNPTRSGLKSFYAQILSLEGRRKDQVLSEIVSRCDTARGLRYRWVGRLGKEYPRDIGVLSPLLLNCFELKPGNAMFLGPGVLHAYLQGLGIEIMANSDNVLRGGLTSKYIDRDELLKTLTFESGSPDFVVPEQVSPNETRFSPRVPEFALSCIDIESFSRYTPVRNGNAEILICTSGGFSVGDGKCGNSLRIERGESFFVFGSSPAYTVEGQGTLFRGMVPS